jgi:hypothetical protein
VLPAVGVIAVRFGPVFVPVARGAVVVTLVEARGVVVWLFPAARDGIALGCVEMLAGLVAVDAVVAAGRAPVVPPVVPEEGVAKSDVFGLPAEEATEFVFAEMVAFPFFLPEVDAAVPVAVVAPLLALGCSLATRRARDMCEYCERGCVNCDIED